MNLSYELFPVYLHIIGYVLYGAVLGFAAKTAPWGRLRNKESLHVFLGSSVSLLVLWSLNAGITPGLNFHLLGATLFTLMFGWQFALFGMSLVLLGITLNNPLDWLSFGLNGLVMGVLPVALSYGAYRFAVRYLPHHFFVYVIGNAYVAGGLAMGLTLLTSTLLLVGWGPYSFDRLLQEYLPFAPFIMFGEGFFSGMLAAGMALFRPEWICTFDDERYLAGK